MAVGDCYRVAFVQSHILQSLADGIGLIQPQPPHHLSHQRGGFQGEQFVIDVGIRLEDTQVGELAHCSGRTALGIVLNQDGSGTCINIRGTQQIKSRYGKSGKQGEGKPVPSWYEHSPQILYSYKIIGRFSNGSFLFYHKCKIFCSSSYLNSSTPNEVRNEAILIHSPTDFTLFSLMVDCPARTLLGCTYTTSFCFR